MHHIREEYVNATQGANALSKPAYSIYEFVIKGLPKNNGTRFRAAGSNENPLSGEEKALSTISDIDSSNAQNIKPVLMEAIQDVIDELETVYENVSKSVVKVGAESDRENS